jgi:hypothetical protein
MIEIDPQVKARALKKIEKNKLIFGDKDVIAYLKYQEELAAFLKKREDCKECEGTGKIEDDCPECS